VDPIATVTVNPALDISCSVDAVVPDAKLRARRLRREPGGGGINVARVIQRLGGTCTAYYMAGGATGDMIEALLAAEGMPQRRFPVEGTTRESIHVLDESSDRQYRFVMPGPAFNASEWERCVQAILDSDPCPAYVVASGSLPPEAPASLYADLVNRLRERGIRLILDASGEPLVRALEAGVYAVKPNLRELGHAAGREIESGEDAEAVARDLLASDPTEMVITSLGAGGVLLVTQDGSERIATPTVPIRSKVGAGDSMVAGTVFQLASGASASEAVRYGAAAGAAAVMTPGTELARRDDVERLYDRMG
jgi:6-phosphofructokinase 2